MNMESKKYDRAKLRQTIETLLLCCLTAIENKIEGVGVTAIEAGNILALFDKVRERVETMSPENRERFFAIYERLKITGERHE